MPRSEQQFKLRGGHVPELATIAGIGEIFWGRGLQQMFNKPGFR
jgi:hypothetical protein